MSNYNQNLLDSMAITSFVIALLNYEENVKQTKNDDIMKEVDDWEHEKMIDNVARIKSIITMYRGS